MSKIIHTALIGFGLSGRVFHAPFIHTHPGFSLSAVVERHKQTSKEIYPDVAIVEDYQALLKNDAIDLMVVATPNIYHFPMAMDCLKAGKHIIIEKPFTPSSHEADELIRTANENKKKIFVFQNRRWDADFLSIRKLIEEGSLGEIKFYEAHFDRYSPDLKPGAWREEKLPGGGIMYDLGSHLIDQALLLFGMPEAIKADIRAERKGSHVDDFFRVELLYKDKVAILTAGMMVENPGPRFIIEGSKARFIKYGIDPQEAMLKAGKMPLGNSWGQENEKYYGRLIPTGEYEKPRTIISEKGDYMGFYNNVYDVLTKKTLPEVKPEQARNLIFIIQKAFEASERKQLIKLK